MSPVPTPFVSLPDSWDWMVKSEKWRGIEDLCVKDAKGCWLYPTYGRAYGYAQIQLYIGGKRQQWMAHRLAWVLVKGPIPAGLYVCHSCDVRNCINPAHLWLGTCDDNQQDRVRKGRHAGNKKIGPLAGSMT